MKREKALIRLGAMLTVIAGLCLSACGGPSTTFASSWRSPKAEPLRMKGENVAAVIMMDDGPTRRNAEDILAREITHHGAKGIAMYTLLPGDPKGKESEAKAAFEAARIKGVVVMRPMGTKTRTETQQVYSDPYYNGYWGGYYGYGWGSAYALPNTPHGGELVTSPVYVAPAYASSGPQTVTTKTEVFQVEILVYSLKQNLLVWGGQSETSDPGIKVEDFLMHLASATADELAAQGLLSN